MISLRSESKFIRMKDSNPYHQLEQWVRCVFYHHATVATLKAGRFFVNIHSRFQNKEENPRNIPCRNFFGYSWVNIFDNNNFSMPRKFSCKKSGGSIQKSKCQCWLVNWTLTCGSSGSRGSSGSTGSTGSTGSSGRSCSSGSRKKLGV